jgi:peptidoglycan/xylan/chitin deacetylase (PgdA/CDA1 family)
LTAKHQTAFDPASIRTLDDYEGPKTPASKARDKLRATAIALIARSRPVTPKGSWIRFPYYHHVFDDERKGFARQLGYFRNTGEIISLDRAVELLAEPRKLNGRYYSITFDDGFRNNLTNAVPLLVDQQSVAAFFLPSSRIQDERRWDPSLPVAPYASHREPEYLTWDECRIMIGEGMTIGAHGVTHRPLSGLGDEDVYKELRDSRDSIEANTSSPCRHFACPWGRPHIDFSIDREPIIAKEVGYSSFLTTQRGSFRRIPHAYMIERDQLMANWPVSQLRYFFSR